MPYFFKVFAFYVGLQYLSNVNYMFVGILGRGLFEEATPIF